MEGLCGKREERRREQAWDMRGRKELDTLTLSDPTPNHFSVAVSVCAGFSLPWQFSRCRGSSSSSFLFRGSDHGRPVSGQTVLGEADGHRRIL